MNILNTTQKTGKLPNPARKLLPTLLACAATLISLPGGAITVPDAPLQTGKPFPAPNMMFILDDSGSMNFVAMPKDVSDPSQSYRDVQRGLGENIIDKSYVNNTIYYNPATTYQPWMRADKSRMTGGTTYGTAYSSTTSLSGEADLASSTQTYYVPKSGVTDFSKTANFIRYQIYLDYGWPRQLRVEECTTYKNGNWSGCSYQTPLLSAAGVTPQVRRTATEEMNNYAVWYSYHRTRMKVAKAGASEAFAQVGSNLRVGFSTIHNRNWFGIPVTTGGGLFQGTNKTTWFSRLVNASASGGTPLHSALWRAGEYFRTDEPWLSGDTGADTPLSCRQNFSILTTDGYWNADEESTSAGDADSVKGAEITGPNGKKYTYEPAYPYKDTSSTTLADVAMHFWKTDLRTGDDFDGDHNDVPTSSADNAFWQHMVTFGVSIGLQGTLKQDSDTLRRLELGSTLWPNPMDREDARRIDDLWHAAVNSRGGFIVANNTQSFVQGLQDAINTMAERQGSASNVTANSTSFVAETRVYQAKYMSGAWDGELAAFDATAQGVASTPAWEASKQFPAWDARKIFTWTTAGKTGGATFPTAAQITALDKSTRLVGPVNGTDNANYIKGDGSRERKQKTATATLRDRDSLLGDIVNSSPMYVKDNDTIFVGANDGMLHAFAATTTGSRGNTVPGGRELFAYIPKGINLDDLASLSNPGYAHKYFVDGPVVVSTRAQTGGQNYLVGALGRGGKGLFGLNVTNPASFGASNVLWDRTGDADNDMGNVLGEPLIVTLNDTNKTKAIVFGNGINSVNGHAVLYVVNIATGELIQRIDTGRGGDNGLSAPRGWDQNGDGTVDYVYAGDMNGNLWKFNFTAASAGVDFGGQPMFTAPSGQAITAGLALAREPITGERWVFVGTGRFMTESDLLDETVQSVYALKDNSTDPVVKADLVERDIVVLGDMGRGFETHGGLASGSRGWFLDLDTPTAGERVVSRPVIQGRVLVFSSMIPPADTNPCVSGGEGYLNAIDAFSGTSTSKPYFDADGSGKVDEGDRLQHGDEYVPVGSIDPNVGMPTLPTVIDKLMVVGGSSGSLFDTVIDPDMGGPRRVSWREVVKDQ